MLAVAAITYLALSRCELLREFVYPEGTTILLAFDGADPYLNSMGGKAVSFYVETPFYGPVPQLSSEGNAYPGFAVYEPIHDSTGLWHLVRMEGISTQVNQVVSQLNIPPGLYNPPKRVGIQAYFLRDRKLVVLSSEIDNPDSATLDTLARYNCADLAIKMFVSKSGFPNPETLVPLVSTPHGKPCVSRKRDAQEGM